MATFNVTCLNPKFREPDPETGCILGCNTQEAYESCRQTFFIKEQNEILKQDAVTQSKNLTNICPCGRDHRVMSELASLAQSRGRDHAVLDLY